MNCNYKRIRFSIILLLSVISLNSLNAQKPDFIAYDSAIRILGRLAQVYQIDTLQRVNVYSDLYLSEDPSVKIDSLVGNYYFEGKSILARLDNAIYLKNDRWSVNVLNDTKEIYLDSVVSDNQLNLKGDPLQMTDSNNYDPSYSYELSQQGTDTGVLKIILGSESQFTEAIIKFKKSTSRMVSAQYTIPTYVDEELESAKSYILIMHFEEPFIDESAGSIFSEHKYFVFDSFLQPHGVGAFQDYKIITAFALPDAIN